MRTTNGLCNVAEAPSHVEDHRAPPQAPAGDEAGPGANADTLPSRPASLTPCRLGCDQLLLADSGSKHSRGLIMRFLESLPSMGSRAWSSYDGPPSTIHSIHSDDAGSCCGSSCSQSSLSAARRPASAAGARPHLQQSPGASAPQQQQQPAGRQGSGSSGGGARALPAVAERRPARRAAGGGGRGLATWSESCGSAPTPSPLRASADEREGDAPVHAAAAGSGRPPAGRCVHTGSRRGVFVGNLPGDVDERRLVQLFSPCGRIDKLWIVRSTGDQAACANAAAPQRGASLGYGFVVFSAAASPLAPERAERELDGLRLSPHAAPISVRVSARHF